MRYRGIQVSLHLRVRLLGKAIGSPLHDFIEIRIVEPEPSLELTLSDTTCKDKVVNPAGLITFLKAGGNGCITGHFHQGLPESIMEFHMGKINRADGVIPDFLLLRRGATPRKDNSVKKTHYLTFI
jgi:hypothetical protein